MSQAELTTDLDVDDEPALFHVEESADRLALCGEFDIAGVAMFKNCAAELSYLGDVWLDLAALRFIDAAGMGALVGLGNSLAAGGHTMTLSRPASSVRRAFTAAGLRHLMPAE